MGRLFGICELRSESCVASSASGDGDVLSSFRIPRNNLPLLSIFFCPLFNRSFVCLSFFPSLTSKQTSARLTLDLNLSPYSVFSCQAYRTWSIASFHPPTTPRHHGLCSTQRSPRGIQSPLYIHLQDLSTKLSIHPPKTDIPPTIAPRVCLRASQILFQRPLHRCRSSGSRRRSRILLLQPRQRQSAVGLLRRDERPLHTQVRGLPEGV